MTGLPFALSLGSLSFLLAVIWGDPFVEILKRLGLGKQIRADVPESHQLKAGTPTMGGAMILIPVIVLTLIINTVTIVTDFEGASVLVPLFALITFGVLGMIDDWEGIQGRRALGEGLSGRVKLAVQIVIAFAIAAFLSLTDFQFANEVLIPLSPLTLPLSEWVYIPIATLVISGMSNAVNLTDGLDGLAGIITASAFAAYGVVAALQGQTYLVNFCFTLVGACFAFLWFNAYPAQLFMGDLGSLSLGAALGVVALMTGQWLLLPVIAVIPMAETLSVTVQVLYAQITRGRRLFRKTPIHHHFEEIGWSEMQIVQRFWLIELLGVMLGMALILLQGG